MRLEKNYKNNAKMHTIRQNVQKFIKHPRERVDDDFVTFNRRNKLLSGFHPVVNIHKNIHKKP